MGRPQFGSIVTLVGLLATVGMTGCDDRAQGLIGTDDFDANGPVNPDERDPRGPGDMGADWRADGDVGPGESPDPRDLGGGEIDEQPDVGHAPDADEDEDDPDAYPEPDYTLPEEVVVGDLGVDGGLGTGDREQLPEQGPVDPSALPVPRCGTFGPAQALRAGPGTTMSFLHTGPGVLFDEPALSGCQPERLRNETDERLLQEMFFEYRWDRMVGWLWQIYTLDGLGYRLPGRLILGGDGRVAWAAYSCVGAVEPEVYRFSYRDAQLLGVDLERPADCLPMAAGESASVRFTYRGNARWPEARQRVLADGTVEHVELEYVVDPAFDERIVAIREYTLGLLMLERQFTYDAEGRVIEETRQPLDGHPSTTRYAYDDQGRLVQRTSQDGLLEIGYDAVGGIEYVLATNPEYVVRELRFPARSRLEPIGMDADPVPADDGWR